MLGIRRMTQRSVFSFGKRVKIRDGGYKRLKRRHVDLRRGKARECLS
jgi:hypothetical protein